MGHLCADSYSVARSAAGRLSVDGSVGPTPDSGELSGLRCLCTVYGAVVVFYHGVFQIEVSFLSPSLTRSLAFQMYRAPMPFFSRYGKLSTGLQRLALSSDPLPENRNHGLHELRPPEEKKNDWDEDEDPVWRASCILYELELQDERAKTAPTTERSFGQIPSVPWLDALQRERALEVLHEVQSSDPTVRRWI